MGCPGGPLGVCPDPSLPSPGPRRPEGGAPQSLARAGPLKGFSSLQQGGRAGAVSGGRVPRTPGRFPSLHGWTRPSLGGSGTAGEWPTAGGAPRTSGQEQNLCVPGPPGLPKGGVLPEAGQSPLGLREEVGGRTGQGWVSQCPASFPVGPARGRGRSTAGPIVREPGPSLSVAPHPPAAWLGPPTGLMKGDSVPGGSAGRGGLSPWAAGPGLLLVSCATWRESRGRQWAHVPTLPKAWPA